MKYVLTEEEAAKSLHFSRRYLAVLRKQGKIKGIKVIRRYVYTAEEIERFQNDRNNQSDVIQDVEDHCHD